jgi:transposase
VGAQWHAGRTTALGIRPFTTGRKNWLFSATVAGANASAVIYSLMLTCRACGIEPYAYLRHVLTELPRRDEDDDVRDLLPFNYVFDVTTASS